MKNGMWKIGATVVVGLLVGSYLSNMADGQAVSFNSAGTATIVGPGMTIVFGEDPLRMHGLEVKSISSRVFGTTQTLMGGVPAGKKFVITDVISPTTFAGTITLATSNTGSPGSMKSVFPLHQVTRLNSGVEFDENEQIWGVLSVGGTHRITLSGYWVTK